MKILCLVCADKVMGWMPEAEADRPYEEYRQLTDEIRAGGHLIPVNRLLPPDAAVTLRVRRGKLLTTDGPFAETKEHFGG